MKRAMLFFLLCRIAAAQQSGVEGVATDSVTHQPMAGVHITLRVSESPVARSQDTYGAMSQRDGHFSVTGVPPAVYFISAQRNGYVYVPGKTPGVTVKAGEITTLPVEMTAQAVISGRVLDENGDPVEHVDVSAVPSVRGSPESSLRIAARARTDERGQFRVIGAPGKFLVMALPQRGLVTPFSEDEGSAYGETYYPGTGTKSQATVVTVTAGYETTGIDIRLTRKRTFTIGGTVTGMPANGGSPMIWFSQSDGSDRFHGMSGFNAFPDGKFVIRGLSPGHYRMVARTEDVVASRALQSEFVDVILENSDATNVALTLAKGESLSGVLEMEGAKGTIVRLEPSSQPGQTGRPKGGEVAPDGAFRFEDVFPGEYRVNVVPLPENAYLKSVNLDGVEMANETLRLSRGMGGAKLSVKVSLNGGQLTGRVLDGDGQPLLNPAFVALAVSADEIQWERLKRVRAGNNFTFNGVRPGKYRLFAIASPAMPEDIALVRAMVPKGTEIEIHEGDRIVKDIQSVSTEGPDAKR
jgi:Carboxypeptidase regulatory-like domain